MGWLLRVLLRWLVLVVLIAVTTCSYKIASAQEPALSASLQGDRTRSSAGPTSRTRRRMTGL